MNRTSDQEFADSLDCDLYRLIGKAEYRAIHKKAKYWLAVAELLKAARPKIRARMHPKDKAYTA